MSFWFVPAWLICESPICGSRVIIYPVYMFSRGKARSSPETYFSPSCIISHTGHNPCKIVTPLKDECRCRGALSTTVQRFSGSHRGLKFWQIPRILDNRACAPRLATWYISDCVAGQARFQPFLKRLCLICFVPKCLC